MFQRHKRFCLTLPHPDALRVEMARDGLSVADMARRYEVGPHAMRRRLTVYAGPPVEAAYCKECEVMLTHPDVQRVGDYCRECAIKIARKQALRLMVPA